MQPCSRIYYSNVS